MEYNCNICNKIHFFRKIKSKIINGILVDFDEQGKELKCCGVTLIHKSKEIGNIFHMKFKSMKPNERAAVLDKRSKEHFKKEGKEMKHEMLKKSNMSGY